MKRLRVAATSILMGVSVIALTCPSGANAQYACSGNSEGQIMVGMTPSSPGLGSVPLCVDDPNYASPQASSAPPAPDPSDILANYARMQFELLHKLAAIANDPEFIKMRDGYWSYFHDQDAPRSGLHCIAMFRSAAGIVQLNGPGRGYSGALLILIGPDIPKPANFSTVLATLDQKIVPPQTVHAFNYSMADGKLGALAFTVPSVEAALAGMKENLTFKVTLEGRQVIDAFYRDGIDAQAKMRECLRGHPPA
ncbi:hypothetical protein SAMN07250955_11760 [Arboricoccus pini]|uniref:Uncharacterized protein n=1 Tax=Arboricoccus pini TaxID=1963835 RepID=A0A212RYW4_9PROT|nr:hypothetical protein [Arboricoccus pini]SNB77912.1 hypothetical protein SAMN07250955_11760 [Arboricoccus pini]